jgi:hypothetical protein
MVYATSLIFPRLSEVCSQHIPGYTDESRAAFLSWKDSWSLFIEEGRKNFEKEAIAKRGDVASVDTIVEAEITRQLNLFKALAAGAIMEKCTDGLKGLKENRPTESLNREISLRRMPQK